MASENGWYTKFPAKLNRIDLENKKFDLEGFMPKGGLCSRSQRWTLIEDDMKMWKKGRVELWTIPECCRRQCRHLADGNGACAQVECRGCFERSWAYHSTVGPTRQWPLAMEAGLLLLKKTKKSSWRHGRPDGSPPVSPQCSASFATPAVTIVVVERDWASEAVDLKTLHRLLKTLPIDPSEEAMRMCSRCLPIRDCGCCCLRRCALHRLTRFPNQSRPHADYWGIELGDDSGGGDDSDDDAGGDNRQSCRQMSKKKMMDRWIDWHCDAHLLLHWTSG